jgi:pyrroline-5-carboxylate reductase
MAGLLLVGGGKMGSALLGGWLKRGIVKPGHITVVEPDVMTAKAIRRRHRVAVVADPGNITARPATVVFAVKPQAMDAVAPVYVRFTGSNTVFLSIAAGKTIGYFQSRLGTKAAIVRAMPNTPAAVGRGITVAVANKRAGKAQRKRCDRLLAAVGEVAWIDDEALMDAVTAVSGSGPAYVFLLVECLAEAGRAAGLPVALSRRLARVTVAGSGELLHRSDDAPETLRKNVTSPGGTTAAAIELLMAADGLQPLLTRAITAAARRSKELAG